MRSILVFGRTLKTLRPRVWFRVHGPIKFSYDQTIHIARLTTRIWSTRGSHNCQGIRFLKYSRACSRDRHVSRRVEVAVTAKFIADMRSSSSMLNTSRVTMVGSTRIIATKGSSLGGIAFVVSSLVSVRWHHVPSKIYIHCRCPSRMSQTDDSMPFHTWQSDKVGDGFGPFIRSYKPSLRNSIRFGLVILTNAFWAEIQCCAVQDSCVSVVLPVERPGLSNTVILALARLRFEEVLDDWLPLLLVYNTFVIKKALSKRRKKHVRDPMQCVKSNVNPWTSWVAVVYRLATIFKCEGKSKT